MTYNLSQIRILWEIASDGLKWANIKGNSVQVGGDFSVLNVKSDVVEQVWRSLLDKDDDSAWFIIDCGETEVSGTATKAIMFDTLALLNHNLSPTAKISVYGYGSASTGAAPTKAQMLANGDAVVTLFKDKSPKADYADFIWVMPVADYATTIIKPRRYWMVHIKDPANTNEVNTAPSGEAPSMKKYIQIGRFVAGEATIFTTEENITSEIEYQEVSYKDEVRITGFTSISNARSIKKKIKTELKNINALASDTSASGRTFHNYKNIKRFIRYCRDTLKSLVIVDSRDPYMFYAYGKLTETPVESCNYLDDRSMYVSMNLEWDEAK
jgi:hypothetical protein